MSRYTLDGGYGGTRYWQYYIVDSTTGQVVRVEHEFGVVQALLAQMNAS